MASLHIKLFLFKSTFHKLKIIPKEFNVHSYQYYNYVTKQVVFYQA